MAAVAASRDYVAALEQELAKIQAFQRELPLSLDLVTRTIESCRRALLLEEEEEERPLQMEEFMPMKGNLLTWEEEERNCGGPHQDKADWLRSAQLWNQHQQLEKGHNDVAMEAEGPAVAMEDASDARSDGAQDGDTGSSANRDGRTVKKERRCWSLDLHRRFLDALQELGGPDVATPKQIKELMNVDGLTSDEIKSHLQKHRIRSKRRAAPATLTAANAALNGQPQVLLGIWVPQGDYAAVAAAAAAAIASLPLEPKQKKQRRQKQSKNGETVAQPRNANSTGSNTTSL